MESNDKAAGTRALLKALGLATVTGAFLAGCASLPDDGKDAKVSHYDGLRAMRYCEVFLIGGDAVTKDLKAVFYNTTDLNNKANPRDTCPAAVWAKLDTEALKKQYGVLGVFKNGPRGWANDWIELPVGTIKTFDGLEARWYGEVQPPRNSERAPSPTYPRRWPANRRWDLPKASRCSSSKVPTACRG